MNPDNQMELKWCQECHRLLSQDHA